MVGGRGGLGATQDVEEAYKRRLPSLSEEDLPAWSLWERP